MNERERSLQRIKWLKERILKIDEAKPVEGSKDKVINAIKKLLEGDKNREVKESIRKIPNGEMAGYEYRKK